MREAGHSSGLFFISGPGTPRADTQAKRNGYPRMTDPQDKSDLHDRSVWRGRSAGRYRDTVLDSGASSVLLAQAGLSGHDYVCVHPGATMSVHGFRFECLRELSRRLLDRGICLALTGSAAQLAVISEFRTNLGGSSGALIGDFVGRTSIGTLTDIVARSRLVISDGSGISQIAAAVHTPSLVIAHQQEAPAHVAHESAGIARINALFVAARILMQERWSAAAQVQH